MNIDNHDEDSLREERLQKAAEAQAAFDRMRDRYNAAWESLEASEEDAATKARRLLTDSAYVCAQRLLHTVMYSANEKLANDASKWILERVAYAEKKETDTVADMMTTYFKAAVVPTEPE